MEDGVIIIVIQILESSIPVKSHDDTLYCALQLQKTNAMVNGRERQAEQRNNLKVQGFPLH